MKVNCEMGAFRSEGGSAEREHLCHFEFNLPSERVYVSSISSPIHVLRYLSYQPLFEGLIDSLHTSPVLQDLHQHGQ